MSSFVYYTHVKFVFKEASEQLLQDNMSDNVHLGEFYACYIFSLSLFFFSLSLCLCLFLNPPAPRVQVCNVNIKKSTFSFECCRQSVSGRVQFLQGVRALQADRQTQLFFFLLLLFLFLFEDLKKKLYLHLLEVKILEVFLFIHMFVAAQVYTHTSLLHSKTQTPRAFDPSAFFFFFHFIFFFQGEDANLEEMML